MWVAAVQTTGESRLYPVSLEGVVAEPVDIPPASALAAGGSLWLLTTEAGVVTIDEATLARSATVRVGGVGQDIGVTGSQVWVASEDLVGLTTRR